MRPRRNLACAAIGATVLLAASPSPSFAAAPCDEFNPIGPARSILVDLTPPGLDRSCWRRRNRPDPRPARRVSRIEASRRDRRVPPLIAPPRLLGYDRDGPLS